MHKNGACLTQSTQFQDMSTVKISLEDFYSFYRFPERLSDDSAPRCQDVTNAPAMVSAMAKPRCVHCCIYSLDIKILTAIIVFFDGVLCTGSRRRDSNERGG